MIKRYCDCCGVEITDRNKVDGDHHQLTGEVRTPGGHVMLRVEVIAAKDNTWNAGDFCRYCVIDAINRTDDQYWPATTT